MTSGRFRPPRRVVVKVGSSSLQSQRGGLDSDLIAGLVAQIATARAAGTEVVLVSSGAVAAGLEQLGLSRRPADLSGLQAAASVGQGILIHTYQRSFAEHDVVCGQVLLTADDIVDRVRYVNARRTFDKLLELGAVPVVNENDTVATDELRYGDNDRLAALVASMLGAGLLLLLSDVEGLLDGDPARHERLPVLHRVDDLSALEAHHRGRAGTQVGSGGMASKLEAVRIATFSAAHAVIANARRPGVVGDVVDGRQVGTWFPPSERRPESRKLWIAFAPPPRGRLVVDAGAVRALTERGSSLLAAGIVDAEGDFRPGDAVDVVGPDQRPVARGLVAYARDEVLRLRGRSTGELVDAFGPRYQREVIHRDSLVVVG
ncbi:MAG TPA: glutamate 5-kinase [Egibacteraceae bacterium]|nr:glutamate 5-kinase [Actinomycetota bacterium]HWB70964.1 glutamate 5-kinase [Egibacteraceae bacterium]